MNEEDGAYLMEGNQVLMLSPDKIRKLHSEGVTEVTCATGDQNMKINLPSQGLPHLLVNGLGIFLYDQF